MRITLLLLVLAMLALTAPGYAQTTPPDPATGQPTIQTDPVTGQPQVPPPPPPPVDPDDADDDYDDLGNEWIVSGFVGGNFSQSALESSFDFGASLSYLYNGAFGAEFLAGFAPSFKLDLLGGVDSDVNNYMGNVIVAIPVGSFMAARPFVSGGIGAITISRDTDITDNDVVNAANALFAPSETHFGGNIGAGIMAFTGAFGIRGDIRYFSALGEQGLTDEGNPSLLDDLSFWRANVGVAFRF